MLTKWAGCSPWQWAGVYPMACSNCLEALPLMSCHTLPLCPSYCQVSGGIILASVYGWISSFVWLEMKAAIPMSIGQRPLISTPRLQASLQLHISPLYLFRKFAEWVLCSPETLCCWLLALTSPCCTKFICTPWLMLSGRYLGLFTASISY